ncbi:MAG: VOC family protein [Nitrospinaceae bacterium]|jgi:lactoylglutathione lyase|nr:VOC family protein [Nitrospinaceae bacterium]MBT3435827.1 VOC family protein [Nitrospinaceae bacterium]MBT3822409.1 VOC family protein [Nitrospinaceae bacterium]MBT4094120.1 VOC family protein [Nitrospinaceae bacterium]MBT4431639.1 VOC family protein [Nitrospinaceae bacterium]
MVVKGYHHAHLVSENPETTAQWYVKALGGEITGQTEGKGSISITMKVGEVSLAVRGLRPNETTPEDNDFPALGIHHFGLIVDDIEGALQLWVDAGGEMLEPAHLGTSGNIVAFVRGPENVMIEFLQPK